MVKQKERYWRLEKRLEKLIDLRMEKYLHLEKLMDLQKDLLTGLLKHLD